MPPGEILVTCPHCQHRTSLPIAAVKRDNYHCSKCLEKIPMSGVRTFNPDGDVRTSGGGGNRNHRTNRR